jgi:transcriptional regulator with XRE-family HTH domain
MSTSQNFSLSKPALDESIPVPTLAYFRARQRRKLHSIVLAEFKKSGITQADLCRRLRKEPAQISRILGSPGNWRLDTVSDLLFAISAAELNLSVEYPLAEHQLETLETREANREANPVPGKSSAAPGADSNLDLLAEFKRQSGPSVPIAA